ncbi:helix-turn-helix domain-containing protein [Paenibacillus koleovorans]|uniref:helix-turn-helix domain-containing protein n=1 Tax=Paenibacillus koleovorans TaxID=121608 RepID=UPI000FDB5616|nr:helix-turn-helix domain-containing protein [Paenibacillus koleovorans]
MHEAYELYYLLEGALVYFIRDRAYSVAAGDLVLIGKNEIHRTVYNGREHERLLINFKGELFAPSENTPGPETLWAPFHHPTPIVSLELADRIVAEELFRRMVKETQEQEPEYELYLKHLLAELLLLATRWQAKAAATSLPTPSAPLSPMPMPKQMPSALSMIVARIDAEYDTPLSLAGLAAEFQLSPQHLGRLFKQATDCTLIEYLNRTRIEAARKLLRETELKVIEIAMRSGFDSIVHFGRVFKKRTGTTPLQYRKQAAASDSISLTM